MKLGPGVQVGRAGMATAFKAFQPALERMVAHKVLPEAVAIANALP